MAKGPWKYSPMYPGLWEREGEKCLHPQKRVGRITLVCARNKPHQGYQHLHDVPPELQVVKS